MLVLLVRHARAGNRGRWHGDDRLRPLDSRGRRQAEAVAAALAERRVDRLVASPYDRCVQTLEPAAALLGLRIEERDELAEGASAHEVEGLVASLDGGRAAALCTHGDVIAAVLGPDARAAKGSFWELEAGSGRLTPKRYVPLPA